MAHAVIIGGGFAGLAAALFAARRGHRITVLERDYPPDDGTAEDDFISWRRDGVPHARQGHVFLARSTQVLREEAPDVLRAILGRGAIEVPLDVDNDSANVLARRIVYEGALRRLVEREPGVTMRSGVAAIGLRVNSKLADVPLIAGVRTTTGENMTADLVIDAAGRRSRAPDWLREAGCRPPSEVRQECGFFYVTRHYRLRDNESFPSIRVPIVTPLDYISVMAFPGDNRRFQLSIAVAVEDPFRHRMRHAENFDRFLAAVPLTELWIARGDPLDDPHTMARIENRWRRLVDERGPIAAGFVLLGDAAVQTNPTTGRGVTLAFSHAQQLAKTLDQTTKDPVGFVTRFEAWTAEHLGIWLQSQVAIDDVRLKQLRAGLRHERLPPPNDPTNRFIAAIAAMRDDDPVVSAASIRLYNLLITPSQLMADREVTRRIIAYLRTHPAIEVRSEGPDRKTFERLVAS